MPTRKDLLFVGLQALLFVAFAVDPLGVHWPVPRWLAGAGWGAALACVLAGVAAAAQLGTSLTPWPSPKAGSELVTTGAYARARHPIYATLLWFGAAVALATGSPWRVLTTVALYLLLRRKAAYEEGLLRARYPGYDAYARDVGRFGAMGLLRF